MYYDEVEIEDMEYDKEEQMYYFPCPCGDKFEISREDLANGDDIGHCPSCSLIIRVIYDPEDYQELDDVQIQTMQPVLAKPTEIVA